MLHCFARLIIVCAIFGSAIGCERSFLTRSQPKPIPPTPIQQYEGYPPIPHEPTITPQSMTIPAKSEVVPPTSATVDGIVPPLPTDADSLLASNSIAEAGPLRERLEEWRQRRAERREDRKERREGDQDDQPKPPQNEPLPPPATPMPPPPPAAIPDRPALPTPMPLPNLLPSTAPQTIPVPPLNASPPSPAPAATPPTTTANPVEELLASSVARYAKMTDFSARQIKREVVNGKPMATSEMEYRFRQKPKSVYMKVLSEEGQGREVLYVQNQFGNKIHLVTGKGDNRLVGAGYQTTVDIDDRRLKEKSRWLVTDAGFDRTLNGLMKNIRDVKSLGQVERKEYPYPLEGVEWAVRPGLEPQLAKGGRRLVFFDPKPDSPSYLLPILVITLDSEGREVEYYAFDRFRAPLNSTDADWNPDMLGKR
jgi:hypothetical protein